ncbi:hypothetical protein WCLE_007980 [Wolbachia endosymbiont of Cimex lectularius]|nr:hypothetical protein WCLE_007980 [Wolbachia endosymbiont of Cimex lectularius]
MLEKIKQNTLGHFKYLPEAAGSKMPMPSKKTVKYFYLV